MHVISLSSPRVMFVIESLSLPAQESSWTGDLDQSVRSPPGAASLRRNVNIPANDSFHSLDSNSAIIG